VRLAHRQGRDASRQAQVRPPTINRDESGAVPDLKSPSRTLATVGPLVSSFAYVCKKDRRDCQADPEEGGERWFGATATVRTLRVPAVAIGQANRHAASGVAARPNRLEGSARHPSGRVALLQPTMMPNRQLDLSRKPARADGRPMLAVVTLLDAAILIRDLEPFLQARPVWDARPMILLAATTGKVAHTHPRSDALLEAI
jgi:hypothetical protein